MEPQIWMSVLPKIHNVYFTAILDEISLQINSTSMSDEPESVAIPK